MKFAFEGNTVRNFISCPDVNPSTLPRFGVCPITTRVLRHAELKQWYENVDITDYKRTSIETETGNYIISTSVNHCPEDWTGWPYVSERQLKRQNVLEFLNEKSLKDLREGRAILVLDQSHEGYQTDWLWNWFHKTVDHYKIPHKAIFYITGNLLAKDQYYSWCETHGLSKKIVVIPHTHFEHMIHEVALNRDRFGKNPVPTLEQQIQYKTENLLKIKDYNLLQKRLRSHRPWAFKTVHDAGVLGFGLINMNPFNSINTWMENKHIPESEANILNLHLPMYVKEPNNIEPDIYYINRITDDIMLDSWISVISEASFADKDGTCFISEKTFKPISCSHPFIIWGNKNSLHYMREMGYKTFHPYIDETYDTLSTWDRMTAIGQALKKFHDIPDKLDWYKRISDILVHNLEVFNNNSTRFLPKSYVQFDLCVKDYFGE
jgi:hypothetical protein